MTPTKRRGPKKAVKKKTAKKKTAKKTPIRKKKALKKKAAKKSARTTTPRAPGGPPPVTPAMAPRGPGMTRTRGGVATEFEVGVRVRQLRDILGMPAGSEGTVVAINDDGSLAVNIDRTPFPECTPTMFPMVQRREDFTTDVRCT